MKSGLSEFSEGLEEVVVRQGPELLVGVLVMKG